MDILFTSPNHFNIFSEGIKMVEDREFSHTAIRWFDPIIKRTVIFHSTIKGVVFYSESRFLEKNKIVEAFTLDLDADSEVEIKAWCHDMAGGHYDYLGILKSAINKVSANATITLPLSDSFAQSTACAVPSACSW